MVYARQPNSSFPANFNNTSIYGGILSPSENPFSNNLTSTTSADNSIYAVKLINKTNTKLKKFPTEHQFYTNIYPNPSNGKFIVELNLPIDGNVHFFITNIEGKWVQDGKIKIPKTGKFNYSLELSEQNNTVYFITFLLNGKYFDYKKIIVNK